MRTQLALGCLILLTSGCSSSTFSGDAGETDNDSGNVPPITGGSDGGSKVDAAPPPGCDPTKLPTDDVCVVNDAEGVFASSSLGSASGDGSKEHPLASLNAAIALAKKNNMRVYACAETYGESITLENAVDVFGYFACQTSWSIGASHAKVQSPTSPAATATNITTATRVEAVDIVAPDFTTQSQSSIGLIASASPALTIKNATIHAGTGGSGANGTSAAASNDSGTAKNGQNGENALVCTTTLCLINFVRNGGSNACNASAGGNGGSGGVYVSTFNSNTMMFSWVPSTNWSTGLPQAATAQTAAGGTQSVSPANGANGTPGSNGASGAQFGNLSAQGYAASDGTNGGTGEDGQGGGGASGYGLNQSNAFNAPSYQNDDGYGDYGASGGAGGCAGAAGTAGKGGGASIALVAMQSALVLDTVTLTSSGGGAGGEGGNSAAATNGGIGGKSTTYTHAAGNGGNGGMGGVSGNGGGGPSIGIAYQGGAPTELASTITIGAGGSGVSARIDSGSGATIPASPSGLAQNTYAF